MPFSDPAQKVAYDHEADRSLDHILPISVGGQHSYANTRLTHTTCNVRRQNRGVAQLRLLG